jgi:uncharacterized protein DUF2637
VTAIRVHVAMAVVLVVGAIAATVSYSHMQELAHAAGESWRSYLIPLTVDGLIVSAGMVLAVRRQLGLPGGTLAWSGLGVGIMVSIAANMADARPEVTAILVAGWAPVSFACTFELLQQLRKLPAPDATDVPAVADRPLTLSAPAPGSVAQSLAAPASSKDARSLARLWGEAERQRREAVTDPARQPDVGQSQWTVPGSSTPSRTASPQADTPPARQSSTRPAPTSAAGSSPVAEAGSAPVTPPSPEPSPPQPGSARPAQRAQEPTWPVPPRTGSEVAAREDHPTVLGSPVTPRPSSTSPGQPRRPQSTPSHAQVTANSSTSNRQGPSVIADQILEALQSHQGTVEELATALGVSESSVYRAKRRSRTNGHAVGAR